jgi:hypothetical protein
MQTYSLSIYIVPIQFQRMYIQIKPNKTRIPKPLFIGLLASTLFYLLLKEEEEGIPWYYYKPAFLMLFLYASRFTVLIAFNYFRIIFYKKACLTISDMGIFDNLTIFPVGQVPWNDISGAEIKKIFNVDFLIVQINNPEKYAYDESFVRRYCLQNRIKRWQSPLVISSRSLNIDLSELRKIIIANSNMG